MIDRSIVQIVGVVFCPQKTAHSGEKSISLTDLNNMAKINRLRTNIFLNNILLQKVRFWHTHEHYIIAALARHSFMSNTNALHTILCTQYMLPRAAHLHYFHIATRDRNCEACRF